MVKSAMDRFIFFAHYLINLLIVLTAIFHLLLMYAYVFAPQDTNEKKKRSNSKTS